HQIAAQRFAELLRDYARRRGGLNIISPIDIVFSDFDVVQPDVVFFVSDRTHLIHLRKPIRVPPDLAVEVLSPSTERTDRGRKMQMLARYGVREYWLVDTETEQIEVFWLNGDTYVIAQTAASSEEVRSTILPDFAFVVRELFDV